MLDVLSYLNLKLPIYVIVYDVEWVEVVHDTHSQTWFLDWGKFGSNLISSLIPTETRFNHFNTSLKTYFILKFKITIHFKNSKFPLNRAIWSF